MLCPMFETLALFATGQLNQPTSDEVAGHLTGPCHNCQEKLEWYKAEASALKSPLKKGPERLKTKARQLFEQSIYARPHLPGFVFATLAFDSTQNVEQMQIRNLMVISKDDIRRLIFHADLFGLNNSTIPESFRSQSGFDIDIEIQQSDDSADFSVRGQILFEESAQKLEYPLYVELFFMGKDKVQDVTANKFGEFMFDNVSEGYYTLQIKFGSLVTVATVPVTV
jgi:hypothetical protein